MATGYTRIGTMLIPYEKPEPVKPTKKAKTVDAVCPMPDLATTPQKSFLESAVEAVKPKRRGRVKKEDD